MDSTVIGIDRSRERRKERHSGDRKQKLKPQILVWSLAFDQFTLGAPAGSMKAPDDTALRFIKTHKPPHHDKVFELGIDVRQHYIIKTDITWRQCNKPLKKEEPSRLKMTTSNTC